MEKLKKFNRKLDKLLKEESSIKFLREKDFLAEALQVKAWLVELEKLKKPKKKRGKKM